MRQITAAFLAPLSTKEKASLLAPLAEAMNEFFPQYEINTDLRLAHFLAQALHEADGFRTLQEYATGDAYDTRTDLGNTPEKDGDGRKYKGRGIFQTTGRTNYAAAGKKMGIDAIKHPELLATPRYAVWSACIYWESRKLNSLADADNLRAITRKINGGYNGLSDRIRYFEICKKALSKQVITERKDATVKDLHVQGSTTIKGADTVQKVSLISGAAAVGGPILNQFEVVSDTWNRVRWAFEPFQDIFEPAVTWIWEHPTFILVPIVIAGLYYSYRAKMKRLEEFKTGKVQ